MDLTEGTLEEKTSRAKRMMLWFGIISLIMSFAGWTSAYIVSSTREDWLSDFEFPQAFMVSVVVILISSITFILAKRAIKKDNRKQTTIFLLLTFVLGIIFIINQFNGFQQIINSGYNFTGPTSNVTMSYIYLIAMVHIFHVVAALISLLVVVVNHFRGKYSSKNYLGLELSATFWHFVDVLWIYLFLFLYFYK